MAETLDDQAYPVEPDSTMSPRHARTELEFPTSLSPEPSVGMEFLTDAAARDFYSAYAAATGFAIRMNKSRRSRSGDALIMRRFVCTRQGFHSAGTAGGAAGEPNALRRRRRPTAREGCMALLEIVRKDANSSWTVSKFSACHTHPLPHQPYPWPLPPQSLPSDTFADDGIGAAELNALLDYLRRAQGANPGFFYAMQLDNANRVTNVLWTDTTARLAYRWFGDAVTFDTTYRKTRYMMPIACFRGVNSHLRRAVFGCCLIAEETKSSYIWLFETWLAAMGGRHPDSIITDCDKAMEAAIARVFLGTQHRFCPRQVLSRCKQKLSGEYSMHVGLNGDLKACVFGADTIEQFESRWSYVLEKYGLWENTWLASIYSIRQQWVPAYQKSYFSPESLVPQKLDTLSKFFKRNFSEKTPLLVFVSAFDQAIAVQREEAQADSAAAFMKPILKTPSMIEKQAAGIYTRAVFLLFQEEFIQSLGCYADPVEGGSVIKYNVFREGENGGSYVVCFNPIGQNVSCSCCKFEHSGILCRHVLRIFFMVGVRSIPEQYVIRRWTVLSMKHKDVNRQVVASDVSFPECILSWYNDLCLDAIDYGVIGATTPDAYKVAKKALQKAFDDLLAAKGTQNLHQGGLQEIQIRHKLPLPRS